MSAPISSATTATTGLSEALEATRPQVQSRRVSLKLGPLGISYSTDQVLWSAAATGATASSALSGTASADAASVSAADEADAAAARQAEAQQTAQTEAQQTGSAFSQEMLNVLRKQVEGRQADTATYGADGTLRGTAEGSGAEAGTELASAAASQDADQDTESQTGQAQQTVSAPSSRMRQAIAAYIACAQDYGAVRPMLTAVA